MPSLTVVKWDLTTKAEGVNRFKMECMAADLPVLVASDVSFQQGNILMNRPDIF